MTNIASTFIGVLSCVAGFTCNEVFFVIATFWLLFGFPATFIMSKLEKKKAKIIERK